MSRITSMEDDVGRRLPALAAFDFGQAFPSISHDWIFRVLKTLNLPGPLFEFLEMIYKDVWCMGGAGTDLQVLFNIGAGIIQGCPASGMLYALASHAFMCHFEVRVETPKLGLVRACADDKGSVVFQLSALRKLFIVFKACKRVANLELKVSNCFLVPLVGDFSPRVARVYSQWLSTDIPEWAEFQVVSHLKYLGLQLGPGAGAASWSVPVSKWTQGES